MFSLRNFMDLPHLINETRNGQYTGMPKYTHHLYS